MKKFDKISNIDPNKPCTWEDTLFLTFDIDWACDDVLTYAIDQIENANIAATWYVTHDTPLLKRMRKNPMFELGIHPNFNKLINGDFSNGNCAEDVVERLIKIVPEASSVRSHSLTQSSGLHDLFKKFNLTHEVNTLIPYHANIKLRPWTMPNGLFRVPFGWEDDVHMAYVKSGIRQDNPLKIVEFEGLKVFDFHPIHIYLNTEKLDRYEISRNVHGDAVELRKHRFRGYGTHSMFNELLGN